MHKFRLLLSKRNNYINWQHCFLISIKICRHTIDINYFKVLNIIIIFIIDNTL